MKVKMKKHQMERWCQDYEVDLLKDAGWTVSEYQDLEIKAVKKLKPTVKSKGADEITLDNANQQGDE